MMAESPYTCAVLGELNTRPVHLRGICHADGRTAGGERPSLFGWSGYWSKPPDEQMRYDLIQARHAGTTCPVRLSGGALWCLHTHAR
jgi:hypothetical protein